MIQTRTDKCFFVFLDFVIMVILNRERNTSRLISARMPKEV